MIRMIVIVGIAITFWSNPVRAVDTDIRVLGLYLSGVEDFTDSKNSLGTIPATWGTSNIGGPTPTTVTLVNGGNPLPLTGFPSGLTSTQFKKIIGLSSAVSTLRSSYAADVVIVFVGPMTPDGTCGSASSNWWVDSGDGSYQAGFVATSGGLDLRGANDSYYAIVSTDSTPCNNRPIDAAHEFGHLLGAGHYSGPPGNNNAWLYADSHSSYRNIFNMFFFARYHTALGRMTSSEDCPSGVKCVQDPVYSLGFSPYGNSSRNNRRALRKTGRSVANYIVSGGSGSGGTGSTQCSDGIDNDGDGLTDLNDSDCQTTADTTESGSSGPPAPPGSGSCFVQTPVNVQAVLVPPGCNPQPPWSTYNVTWSPGSSCQPDYYEVYSSFPDGSPYTFFDSTPSTSITGYITGGQNARARVRACVFGIGCTGLSLSSAVVVPIC